MNGPATGRKAFHLSIGSVFVAFLFFGGFESLIRLCRDPLAHAVTRMLPSFIRPIQETPTDWTLLSANLAVALIFLVFAAVVGARMLKKQRIPAN